MKTAYLLTGLPGIGKTTLIKQIAANLHSRVGGFYTEEVRQEGVRQGFRIITLEGQTALLAGIDIASPYRVSKYGVDIAGLESVGVASLQKAARDCEIVIVDEIGKMEIFSTSFKSTITRIIDSGQKVLGTIMLKPNPWTDGIKHQPQVQVLTLTRFNRREVLEKIQSWLYPASSSHQS